MFPFFAFLTSSFSRKRQGLMQDNSSTENKLQLAYIRFPTMLVTSCLTKAFILMEKLNKNIF